MLDSPVADRTHVHTTALGKVLAAYLSETVLDDILARRGMPAFNSRTLTDAAAFKAHLLEVQRRGYAVDDEESKPGQRCIAAPVQDHAGSVIAAIAVAGPSYLFPPEDLPETAARVSERVNALSRALGCPAERLIRHVETTPVRAAAAEAEDGVAVRQRE